MLHGIRVSSHSVFIWEKRAVANRSRSLEDVLEKIRSFQDFKGFAVNVWFPETPGKLHWPYRTPGWWIETVLMGHEGPTA